MTDYYDKLSCRLCESRDLEDVLSLPATPPGNHFVAETDTNAEQKRYPLGLRFCRACTHVQLSVVVDPRVLYQQNYSYVSSTSPVFVKHLKDYASAVLGRFRLGPRHLVLDIGSNDGTALGFFKEAGCRVLGIDPATAIAKRASARGIETLAEFFTEALAERCAAIYGPANLITSHNTCAHVDDLDGLVKGVCRWLADDGIFVCEVGYLLDVLQNCWFDTIYHEHLDYHALQPLVRFLERHGLQVIDVERTSQQGGSIRVYSAKKAVGHVPTSGVRTLVEFEEAAGLGRADTYRLLDGKIRGARESLHTLISDIRSRGKRIAGYGAPTKATTLLAALNLEDAIEFIAEDNPLKQNLYTPGSHIPVLPTEAIYSRQPDYVIVLAWNFAEDIMRRHARYVEGGGRFITPLPTASVHEERR